MAVYRKRARPGRRLAVCALVPAVVIALLVGERLAGPAGAASSNSPTEPSGVVSPGVTELMSGSAPANSFFNANNQVISADGRYVAFDDIAPLDPLANTGPGVDHTNVYVTDRVTGRTVLISRGRDDDGGETGANGESTHPSISADGRYVAFQTTATNIADVDVGGNQDIDRNSDIVICDRDPNGDGVFDQIVNGVMDYRCIVVGDRSTQVIMLASFTSTQAVPAQPTGPRVYDNTDPSISNDGTVIAWQQEPDVFSGEPPDRVFVARLGKGADGILTLPATTSYLPMQASEDLSSPIREYGPLQISGDGQHVVFFTNYALPPHTLPAESTAVEIEDIASQTTFRVDLNPLAGNLPYPGDPIEVVTDRDGQEIAFSEVFPGFTSLPPFGVLVARRSNNGPIQSVSFGSIDASGVRTAGENPALSGDGRYLAFSTDVPNVHDGVPDLDPPCEESCFQVVVRDLVVDAQRAAAGLTPLPGELASPALPSVTCAGQPSGGSCEANGHSFEPVLSGNGLEVAYGSTATDMVPGTPEGTNVFVRQFQPYVQADPANFGVVTLGRHATAMLTVRHEGFGPAHISALRVTGRNPGDFTVPSTACQATIYEADTCTLPVTFTPRAPGPRSGVVQLTTDTSGTVGAASVSGGAVTPISLMSFTPGQATFGPQTVQTSSVITVQGVNTSNDPVTISSIVPTLGAGAFPGDYSVSGTCVGVIQPHATCVEAITFSPHGPGVRPDMLAFVDSTGAQITMSVTGRGLLPTASLGPQAVPDGQVVTVRGNDFPPNYPVVATIPTLDGQASTASVTTDATGAFVASIVIFPNAEQGLQPVVVTAPETTVQLTLPLLVTRHLDITPYLGS